jgi:hypothetical protein
LRLLRNYGLLELKHEGNEQWNNNWDFFGCHADFFKEYGSGAAWRGRSGYDRGTALYA